MTDPTTAAEALAAYRAECQSIADALEALMDAKARADRIAETWRSQTPGGLMGDVPLPFDAHAAHMWRLGAQNAGLVASDAAFEAAGKASSPNAGKSRGRFSKSVELGKLRTPGQPDLRAVRRSLRG